MRYCFRKVFIIDPQKFMASLCVTGLDKSNPSAPQVMKKTKIQLPSQQQCKQTALGDTTIGNVAGMANYGTSFADD